MAGTAQAEGLASRRPVVLQVLPALVSGGVERGTVDIAAALVRAGWGAVVASSGGPMTRQVERVGGLHVELPLASKNPLTIRRNAGRLAELIEAQVVTLVHARSRAPAFSARRAAQMTGRPFVTTYHGTYNEDLPFKRRYNGIMASGDRVIAISYFIADHIRRLYPEAAERVITIQRGIDTGLFDPTKVTAERMVRLARAWRLPDDRAIVLLPGRYTRWKGHAVLIEALRQMRRADMLCLMVGDSSGHDGYRKEMEQLAAQGGVGPVVRLIDRCDDMPAAYMLADVVVSASTDPEAFGRVAVEAQAMGRPVVATAHGGSLETVLDGRTGWLVPPGDATAMGLALHKALDLDKGMREQLAEAARAHVLANFTVDRMCDQELRLYHAVLSGTPPAGAAG